MNPREFAVKVIRTVSAANCSCPAHSNTFPKISNVIPAIPSFRSHAAEANPTTDYAFEMKCSNIRYGAGVTKEVGMDLKHFNSKNVCVITDSNLSKLPPVKTVLESLHQNGVSFKLFDRVRVEPTDKSFKEAIEFCKKGNFDSFLAVGGGSVMDTCKAANLYSSNPNADFLDYVNAPIGKGLPISVALKPMIAVPTTAGTGSETTGVAIFDYLQLKAKTGIASRALCPTLGIVDPIHLQYLPERVAVFSGFDVLCHALESYTAIPYNYRSPCPLTPQERPVYQGSNPVSDIWSLNTLRMLKKYFKRAISNRDDLKALSKMHLASTFAGIGFGNAGVHLCHGMSYPISAQVKNFKVNDYKTDYAIIPHGLSVVITAPAVFKFTAPANPQRHLDAAEALGKNVSRVKKEDAGLLLSDTIKEIMQDLKIVNGLAAFGYDSSDIPSLVEKTIPQERVTKLSPRAHTEETLARMLEDSMVIY